MQKVWTLLVGVSATSFKQPARKSKGSGGKKTKKTGPNLTGASTALVSDADRDAALIEIGMDPHPGTSGNSGEDHGCHRIRNCTSVCMYV